ncbi:MAG: hypothetical protein WDW38_009660 [Sanguina aurantia]
MAYRKSTLMLRASLPGFRTSSHDCTQGREAAAVRPPSRRYDEFGRLKKKFRETGGSDRDAREKAALARLRGESDGGGQSQGGGRDDSGRGRERERSRERDNRGGSGGGGDRDNRGGGGGGYGGGGDRGRGGDRDRR